MIHLHINGIKYCLYVTLALLDVSLSSTPMHMATISTSPTMPPSIGAVNLGLVIGIPIAILVIVIGAVALITAVVIIM